MTKHRDAQAIKVAIVLLIIPPFLSCV